MPLQNLSSPRVFLDTFTLPNALPGTAQLICGTTTDPSGKVVGFPVNSYGFSALNLIELIWLADATVTIHQVPNAGSATTANRIVNAVALNSTNPLVHIYWNPRTHLLLPGYQLFCFASVASAINCAIYGEDYT